MAREAIKPQRETSAQEWQRIRELLAEVLKLSPAERSQYLNQKCGENAELRARLDELIAAHDSTAAAGLDKPAFSITRPEIDQKERQVLIGRRIGPYRIEAEIAHGGMGTVLRAVRADDEFKKQVAIKLVGAASFSSQAAEMFRRERQVLADLEHPNIAHLLDGGTTEDGIPYLVMEYVEGQPVSSYCQGLLLSIEERLKLFQKICAAVHYAHQHLVIHRDLKPANILVTTEGEPKLLDFGIAKIIDLEAARDATSTAWHALTPAYASPEQISGLPITTASDIYSLGAVLYEVLTDKQAFPANRSPLSLQQRILERDPVVPSKAVLLSGKKLSADSSRLLSGDMDSIVSKALSHEPSERYSSVAQFSEDIGRYLEHQPVMAHQPTAIYRMKKFIRRHKTGVLTAALFFVLLTTGVAAVVRAEQAARMQQARAERRFNDVRKLANSLLFDVHDAVQDLPGSTPARKLIVEKSLEYLDSLSFEAGSDAGLLRELAIAYTRVGELQGHYLADNLGENSNSLASYRKALKIRQELGERRDAAWADRLALAESYRRMASQLSAADAIREALTDIQKATEISESVAKTNPSSAKVLYELGFDYEVLGNIDVQSHDAGWGDLNVAMDAYRKALAADKKMLALDPNSLDAQRGRALDMLQIGNAQTDLDDFSEATETFNEVLTICRSITQRSTAVKDRRRVGVAYNQLGALYDRSGNWKLSLEDHEKGLAIYKDLVAEDPKNALLRQGLAIAYANTGDSESKFGRVAEARAHIDQGIAMMKTLMADPNAQQREILAQMYVASGENLLRSRLPSAALSQYQQALEIYGSMHGDPTDKGRDVEVATCKLGIASAERLIGNREVAVADLREALTLTAPWVVKKDRNALRDAAQAYASLGDIESAQAAGSEISQKPDHWQRAARSYRQSLEIGKQIPPYAQLDPLSFRAVEVERSLHRAERELARKK